MSNTLTYLGATYSDTEIISGSFSKSESLNMAELPVDTVEITVRPALNRGFLTHEQYPFFTADNYRFETTEPLPFSMQFQQNAPLVQYKDGSQTAIWYLQSIDRIGSDIYKFNGISSLGRLTQQTHYGGIYNGVQAQTIIAEIMGDIPYYVDNVFKTVLVYGWLPIATARDNLQQLLFALNANIRTAADGTLRIENLPTDVSAYIAASDIFQNGANVKYNSPVSSVVVLEHKFTESQESKTLYESVAPSLEDITITFNEPMYNLSWSGGALVDSGANYAVIPSGTVGTLTGNSYIHTTTEVERPVTTADIPNVVRVENATLVGETAVADVTRRLSEYYACRNVINVAVAQSLLNPGDTADVFDPYDEIMRSAVIEKSQVALSATPKSTIAALVGFVPWQQEASVDVHDIISTSGTYTFPADIPNGTEVRCILIGGGQGGTNGGNGGNGESGSGYSYTSDLSKKGVSLTAGAGAGGAGGVGGVGGKGGKILEFTLVVNANDSYAAVIGAGGTNGAMGGNTTFAGYSSADGATIDYGYYDSKEQKFFGATGTNGGSGAKGGNGGANGAYGEDGGSLADYTGGSGGKGYLFGIDVQIGIGGGGGGGAAPGSNGIDAQDSTTTFVYGQRATGHSYGANGVNGSSVTQPTAYGAGGNGGNGGSGGGGCGYATMYVDKDNRFSGIAYTVQYTGTGGTGGSGTAGTDGVSGCVVLIYRKPAS